jgi:hypothetical protein
MTGQYVDNKTFHDFVENQQELIKVLNHSMTELMTDVKWIKKTLWWIMGIFSVLICVGLTQS